MHAMRTLLRVCCTPAPKGKVRAPFPPPPSPQGLGTHALSSLAPKGKVRAPSLPPPFPTGKVRQSPFFT
ncbi:hypothetical protein T484DRAFT_1977286, partial [Baffinella frigidus]